MKTESLRVGYVVERYPCFRETSVVNELLAHEAAGHSLEIFSLDPPNDTHFQDEIPAVRAPVSYLATDKANAGAFWQELNFAAAVFPGFWAGLAAARDAGAREVFQAVRLAQWVRQRGIGLLHAHSASTAAEAARLAARWAGVPYTCTAQARDTVLQNTREDELRRRLAEAATVVTVSEFHREDLRSRFGAAANHVRRLYNGLNLDRFRFVAPHRRAARVVAVGPLVEKTGFEVLVAACARLAAEGRTFHCDILGAGDREAALRSQIARFGLAHQVRLLGPRPQIDVIRHIHTAAVLAVPRVVGAEGAADGLPAVLLEAMALGTPCVATDADAIPELVRDGETGLLVAQGDPVALARALARLLDIPALRLALAKTARDLVEREFDIRRNAAVLWEIFERAVEAHVTTAAAASGATASVVDPPRERRLAPPASPKARPSAHALPEFRREPGSAIGKIEGEGPSGSSAARDEALAAFRATLGSSARPG